MRTAASQAIRAARPNRAGAYFMPRALAAISRVICATKCGIGGIKAGLRAGVQRRGDLVIDATGARGHQHDAAREECCLVDRMRDEDHGAAEFLPQRQQVFLQLVAGEFVERGEWFVHQQQARARHQCAGDRHAHAHAAGKLARTRMLEAGQADATQRFVHLRRCVRCGSMPRRRSGRYTLSSGARPGQQRGVLEHEADFAGRGLVAGVPDQRADVRLVEAGDQAQQRGLAAAGRAEQRDEVARSECPAIRRAGLPRCRSGADGCRCSIAPCSGIIARSEATRQARPSTARDCCVACSSQ